MKNNKFNTAEPLGYFITWAAYGTWLPGDERGWQRKGFERQSPNSLFREMAASKMGEAEFCLNPHDREIVKSTVCRHCQIRDWELHAVDARSNHVHVIVNAPGYKPEVVREQLKAWSTRKMKAVCPDRKKFWVEGGSRRYLNTQQDLENAMMYVTEAQDRRGLDE